MKRTPVSRRSPEKNGSRKGLFDQLVPPVPRSGVKPDLSDRGEQKRDDLIGVAPAYVTPVSRQEDFFPDSDDSGQQQHNNFMYNKILTSKTGRGGKSRMIHSRRMSTREGRTGTWEEMPESPPKQTRPFESPGSPSKQTRPLDLSWRKEPTVTRRPKIPSRSVASRSRSRLRYGGFFRCSHKR